MIFDLTLFSQSGRRSTWLNVLHTLAFNPFHGLDRLCLLFANMGDTDRRCRFLEVKLFEKCTVARDIGLSLNFAVKSV